MSSADLDYIRALLVAQTAEPEPEPQSLLARLFAARPEPPRRRPPPLPRFAAARGHAAPARPDVPSDAVSEPELLLEHMCRPPRSVETAPAVPPSSPRGEFGRRPEIAPQPELILDQPAATARRLQLLDVCGQPVGEIILQPDQGPTRGVLKGEDVPYFPEDLLETVQPQEPEPLRPWLKALRASARAQQTPSNTGAGAGPHRRRTPKPATINSSTKHFGDMARMASSNRSVTGQHAFPGPA